MRKRLLEIQNHYFPDYYADTLKSEFEGCQSLLELGCGRGSPAAILTRGLYSVGVDLHLLSLKKNKEKKQFDDYILADLNYLPFRTYSFDVVAALDVLEHFPKSQGTRLIAKMEATSRNKVIIFTPNGYSPQPNFKEDNPLQRHKSGWVVSELTRKGYVVLGINGIAALRGKGCKPTIKPTILGAAISRISDRFVFRSPSRAFALLCIKNNGQHNQNYYLSDKDTIVPSKQILTANPARVT